MFKYFKEKKDKKLRAFQQLVVLYEESRKCEYVFKNTIKEVENIKIIKASSEDDFSKKYNEFMASLNISRDIELGNISDLQKEKIEFKDNEFITALYFNKIVLKYGISEDDYSLAKKTSEEAYKKFRKAEFEYNSEFWDDFYSRYLKSYT